MKNSWNLDELRAHIRARNGDPTALLEVVSSIDRSTQIFSYHLITARDALKGIIEEREDVSIKNLEFVFGISNRQDDYAYAKIVNEANVIGCIHAARSILDIFSHLINDLLLCSSLQPHICDIVKDHDALPDCDLKDHLGRLLTSYWFNYVSGFINTTKHRRLVPHKFSVSFLSGAAGIQLGAFEYKGTEFPVYTSTEVLQGVLDVKNAIVGCGRALNRMCITADA
jgi:hypothetical protein